MQPTTNKDNQMVARVTDLRGEDPAAETAVRMTQRKRPETGRYLLQVDRQTKASYPTVETAEAAGMVIKTGYPLVQISVYDSVECRNTSVALPIAPQEQAHLPESPVVEGRKSRPRTNTPATKEATA
ncbi:MAG: hypothetical protein ACRECO_09400 [Xanthobacteraceae bacterium]